MRNWFVGAALALGVTAAQAAIKEEPVTYKDGDTTLKGFIVYDDAKKGRRPGMVVVHEWWGITKHTRAEARRFAQQGYTAFVADMYGDAKSADNPKDASGLMKGLMGNPASVDSRFKAARAQLAKHATVNAKKIGASGYCMGLNLIGGTLLGGICNGAPAPPGGSGIPGIPGPDKPAEWTAGAAIAGLAGGVVVGGLIGWAVAPNPDDPLLPITTGAATTGVVGSAVAAGLGAALATSIRK